MLLAVSMVLGGFSVGLAQVGLPIEGRLRGPATVLDVVDGETLLVRINDRERDVLLNGIDAPEEAAGYLERLVSSGRVFLEFDVANPLLYDPLPFAYIYVPDPRGDWEQDGQRYTQVNLELLKVGLADVLAIPPDIPYVDLFVATLEDARDNERGIWRDGDRQPRGVQLNQNAFYRRFIPDGEAPPLIDTFGQGTEEAASDAPAGEFDVQQFAAERGLDTTRTLPSLNQSRTNQQDILDRLRTAQADFARVGVAPASSMMASTINADGTMDLARAGARPAAPSMAVGQTLNNVQALLNQMNTNVATSSNMSMSANMSGDAFPQATTAEERMALFSPTMSQSLARRNMAGSTMGAPSLMTSGAGMVGTASITFSSEPSGAFVWIDGGLVGNTPISVNLPVGQLYSYTVSDAQRQFNPVNGSLNVRGDEMINIALTTGIVTSNMAAPMPVARQQSSAPIANPFASPQPMAAPAMTTPAQPTPQASTPRVIPTEAATFRYDPLGPDRNCSDFTTQAEAQAFFDAAGGTDNDIHQLDRNGDGVVCTGLP